MACHHKRTSRDSFSLYLSIMYVLLEFKSYRTRLLEATKLETGIMHHFEKLAQYIFKLKKNINRASMTTLTCISIMCDENRRGKA